MIKKESQVGDTRTFEFSNKKFEIVQILKDTNTKMDFLWNKTTCPYCSKTYGHNRTHAFNRIEVLIPQPIEENKKEKEVVLLGFSDDERTILVTPKLNELRDKIEILKGVV